MLGYAQPINQERVKYWLTVAADAAKRRQEIHAHIYAFLLKWEGKVVNKRLWDAIYADPWYKANGYHAWHDKGYSGTERLRIEPSPTRSYEAGQELKRKPGYSYRDDNHWSDAQSWSINIIDHNSDTGDRLSLAYIQIQAPPDKAADMAQLLQFLPEHVRAWNEHLKEMARLHDVYGDACYLLGMLFDVSKDW